MAKKVERKRERSQREKRKNDESRNSGRSFLVKDMDNMVSSFNLFSNSRAIITEKKKRVSNPHSKKRYICLGKTHLKTDVRKNPPFVFSMTCW